MLQKTSGIVLSYIKYKETSIIARIFTEAYGTQSFIVNGIRSKSAKTKIALFQPLTLLDLVVYHNSRKQIQRISEVKCQYTFHSIPYNIRKTTVALFLTELLSQTLIEEGENEELFVFINDSVKTLDLLQENYGNFHLRFMLYLSTHLGIKPESADMILSETGHAKSFDKEFAAKLNELMTTAYNDNVKMSKNQRYELLNVLIHYYQLHFDSIRDLKSVQVLKEVFS